MVEAYNFEKKQSFHCHQFLEVVNSSIFLNFLKSLSSSKRLAKLCSTETAKKLAPNIVSGRVVKIFIFLSCL